MHSKQKYIFLLLRRAGVEGSSKVGAGRKRKALADLEPKAKVPSRLFGSNNGTEQGCNGRFKHFLTTKSDNPDSWKRLEMSAGNDGNSCGIVVGKG